MGAVCCGLPPVMERAFVSCAALTAKILLKMEHHPTPHTYCLSFALFSDGAMFSQDVASSNLPQILSFLRLSVIAFVTKPLNFQPPKKSYAMGYTGPYFGPTNTNHTKITKKSLLGHFLGYPPKMHYSALQCSAMYCSVNA